MRLIYPEMAGRDKEVKRDQSINEEIELVKSRIRQMEVVIREEEASIALELAELGRKLVIEEKRIEEGLGQLESQRQELRLQTEKLTKCRNSSKTMRELIRAGDVGVHWVEWGQILTSYLAELKALDEVEEGLVRRGLELELRIEDLEKLIGRAQMVAGGAPAGGS